MADYVIFLFYLGGSLGVIDLDSADTLFEQGFLGPYYFQVLSLVSLIGAEHELILIDRSDRCRG